MRVADYIIDRLIKNKINQIFLITGRGILYLTDAVAKNSDIDAVSTYHEQGASYAAMAYASAKNGMGACLVSTGCGAANAITAALCAYQDNLPVIFISGQNMLEETTRYTGLPIRTYGSQEADIVKVVSSITKYSTMIENPMDIGVELDKAFYYANEGRKGPVWIDIPLDIQNARIEEDELQHWQPDKHDLEIDCHIDYVLKLLNEAKRPIIFAGGGVRSAQAIPEVTQLVENYRIPLVFSTSAADTYGTGNELSIGTVGSLGGSRAGNMAVQNADFVLCLGSKLCSQTVGKYDQFAREAKLVVVDIDEYEHTKKGVAIDKIIYCDIKRFLQQLLNRKIAKCDEKWIDKCIAWKEHFSVENEMFVQELVSDNKIDLYYLSHVLSKILDKNATIITDAGFEELIIPSSIKYKNGQRCLFPASQGAMGYAIPAIIGAYYAGRKNIVAVVGDGSFMMNLQELLTISSHNIPVKILVINNNMYSVIRKRQKDLFRSRTIGNDPSDGVAAPDFKKIANCFDFQYRYIEDANNILDNLLEVLNNSEPVICEIKCVENQKYLHTSVTINEKRKMVRRPLEDLSPYIDRDMFYREMIIKPIEE